jgi:hypothetical protein
MQTMHWYNPVAKEEGDLPTPMSDAQAIEMLSGHPDSDRFIEDYRRMRAMHPGIVEALVLTGTSAHLWSSSYPPRGSANVNYAVSQGEHERLQPRVHPEFGQDAGHMVAFCWNAYVEPLGDLLAVEAIG